MLRAVLILIILIIQCNCKRDRPNIVLILTDDQDTLLRSLDAMKAVQKLIGEKGATFKNSFVNSPVCCPSRSTLLTGKYPHNTGVTNNSIAGNCSSRAWQTHHEPRSFVSLLKTQADYTTFYAGKYLNMYGDKDAGGIEHVPKGYDWWIGLKGNSKYYNYTLSLNGTGQWFSDRYLTDVMTEYALAFLNRQQTSTDPFFMMLAPPACHAPFTPAPRHQDKFPGVKALRTPSFNYSDDNRHWLIRMPPKYLPSDVSVLDDIQRKRYQTLLAVDEMVEEIIAKLGQIGVLDDTYVIFTSDNGYHLGQFVQAWDKRQPYETDLRVPLLIRGPLIKPGLIFQLPVATVDVGPTVLDMAGIQAPDDVDGRSFYRKLVNGDDELNGDVLVEYHGEAHLESVDKRCPWVDDSGLSECSLESWCKCQDAKNNTYTCLRRLSSNFDFKFCEFFDDENFMEAYDLLSDPDELQNIYQTMKKEDVLDNMKTLHSLQNCSGKLCRF